MTDERQVDWHGIAVSACVWPEYNHWVDWVQVSDAVRGLGLGEELLRGIEKHTGWDMTMTGTTKSGDRMLDRIHPVAKHGDIKRLLEQNDARLRGDTPEIECDARGHADYHSQGGSDF